MNKIIYKGVKEFNGKEIKVLEGGFGENCRIMTAHQIAEIHGAEVKDINRLTNENINEFDDGVDILNLLKVGVTHLDIKNDLGIDLPPVAKNFFIYSEQGYMALVGLMRSDEAREIRKKVRREYFAMREIINSDEQKIAQLTLSIYKGGQDALISAKELSELEVAKAVKPLNEKIATDKPLVEFAEQVSGTADFIDIGDFAKILNDENIKIGRNRLFNWLRDNKYIMKNTNIPYQNHIDNGMFKVIEVTKNSVYGTKIFPKTVLSGSGQLKLMSKIKQDYEKGLIK